MKQHPGLTSEETNTKDVGCLTSEFGMGSGITSLLWPFQINEFYIIYKAFYIAISK